MDNYLNDMFYNEGEVIQYASPQLINKIDQNLEKDEMKNSILFVAADLGAGNIKIRTSKKNKDGEDLVWMPSLIAKITKDEAIVGYKSVLDGAVFQMSENGEDIFWFGQEDVSLKELVSERASDDPNLKINNAPLHLTSVLIKKGFAQPDVVNYVALALTHHDAKTMGEKLANKIEGRKVVTQNELTYTFVIKLIHNGIHQEGSKIVTEFNKAYGQLDLGDLTSLYTRRNASGGVIKSYTNALGVSNLLDMIIDRDDFRAKFGGIVPNRAKDLLAKAIRKASNLYEQTGKYTINVSGQDIKDVYRKALLDWLKQVIAQANKDVVEEYSEGYKVIAVGGGTKLPEMKKSLEKFGIEIYSDIDPMFANVNSLYDATSKACPKDLSFFEDSMDSLNVTESVEVV
jgi:hypothetical protein